MGVSSLTPSIWGLTFFSNWYQWYVACFAHADTSNKVFSSHWHYQAFFLYPHWHKWWGLSTTRNIKIHWVIFLPLNQKYKSYAAANDTGKFHHPLILWTRFLFYFLMICFTYVCFAKMCILFHSYTATHGSKQFIPQRSFQMHSTVHSLRHTTMHKWHVGSCFLPSHTLTHTPNAQVSRSPEGHLVTNSS